MSVLGLGVAVLLAAGVGRGYAPQQPIQPASIAGFGDSIFAGACGTPVAAALGELLPVGYVEETRAIAGENAHQIYVRAFNESGIACLGGPCGAYIVNGGVNTLKDPSFDGTAPEVVAEIALYGLGECAAEVDYSCGMLDVVDLIHFIHPYATVILTGVLPYGGCDALTCPSLVDPVARASAYNAVMAEECAARTWLRCVYPYAAFEDPNSPGRLRLDVACQDGIHLLPDGHAELASMVKAVHHWR
jgi:hypothetical protein